MDNIVDFVLGEQLVQEVRVQQVWRVCTVMSA